MFIKKLKNTKIAIKKTKVKTQLLNKILSKVIKQGYQKKVLSKVIRQKYKTRLLNKVIGLQKFILKNSFDLCVETNKYFKIKSLLKKS